MFWKTFNTKEEKKSCANFWRLKTTQMELKLSQFIELNQV